MAVAAAGRRVVRISDVLPAADFMVALRRLALARPGGLFVLQLFEQSDWKEDWPLADHCAMVDADGAGIIPIGDWIADHST